MHRPTEDDLTKHAIARSAGDHVPHATGQIIAYCAAPMVCILTEDGTHVWWRADLTEVLPEPSPVLGVVTGGHVDPVTGARYWWPAETDAPPDPIRVPETWREVGYTTDEENHD